MIGFERRFTFAFEDFDCVVLHSSPPACLIAKRKGTGPSTFEVVLLHRCEQEKTSWGQVPAGWYMPTNEEWGERGWSYASMSDAMLRYNALRLLTRKEATRRFDVLKKRHGKKLLNENQTVH